MRKKQRANYCFEPACRTEYSRVEEFIRISLFGVPENADNCKNGKGKADKQWTIVLQCTNCASNPNFLACEFILVFLALLSNVNF